MCFPQSTEVIGTNIFVIATSQLNVREKFFLKIKCFQSLVVRTVMPATERVKQEVPEKAHPLAIYFKCSVRLTWVRVTTITE